MTEVHVGLASNPDTDIIREEHLNQLVLAQPKVILPTSVNEDEVGWPSSMLQCIQHGEAERSWVLDTYARTMPPPVDCLNYVGYAFLHYGLKVPPRNYLEEVFKYLIYYVDYVDPDLFFHGITDVVISNDKYYYTYMYKRPDGRTSTFLVNIIDVFTQFAPYEANYHRILSRPGLTPGEGRPMEMQAVWDFVSDEHTFDDHFSEHWGEYFGHYYTDVTHLSMWSMLMWMIGPSTDAVAWRSKVMPVFDMVRQHGECICEYGTYFTPDEYVKVQRPVGTCTTCGVKLPCAETYEIEECTHYFCAAHRPIINGERLLSHNERFYRQSQEYNCQSCEFTECPHNNATKLQIVPRGRGRMLMTGLVTLQNNLGRVASGKG